MNRKIKKFKVAVLKEVIRLVVMKKHKLENWKEPHAKQFCIFEQSVFN